MVPVNVRVIAGSKRDLKQLVAEGKFREDLKSRAAELLQIKRSTLGDRINRCGLGSAERAEHEPEPDRDRASDVVPVH